MFNVELILRAAAVVAAVAVVAGPYLVARLPAALLRRSAEIDDTHTILDIARRLQKAGVTDGVKLCQQLLDVLLKPEKK